MNVSDCAGMSVVPVLLPEQNVMQFSTDMSVVDVYVGPVNVLEFTSSL